MRLVGIKYQYCVLQRNAYSQEECKQNIEFRYYNSHSTYMLHCGIFSNYLLLVHFIEFIGMN